jgi:hypothetical protein
MTLSEFAAKWRGVTTGERASAQSHFLDLCRVLGQPGPTDADPTGEWYAFEKGAEKFDGRDGFADVWKKGFFAWEYKGKRKDLKAAYRQLVDYKNALENPPLLVVSDLATIEAHTNFTGLSPVTKARAPRGRPPREAAHSSDRFPCRRPRSRPRRRRPLSMARVRVPAAAWPLWPGCRPTPPDSPAACANGLGGAAYAAPSPRSGGSARG